MQHFSYGKQDLTDKDTRLILEQVVAGWDLAIEEVKGHETISSNSLSCLLNMNSSGRRCMVAYMTLSTNAVMFLEKQAMILERA